MSVAWKQCGRGAIFPLDHIAHQVELYREKEHDQKEQDQETLGKLTQIKRVDNKRPLSTQAPVGRSR